MPPTPHWALRQRLSPSARHRVRSLVDPLLVRRFGSWRATGSSTHVALTFDDGPDPDVTPPLLDLLDEMSAPSTFFLLVGQCRKWPALAAETAARGHEIALHGIDHSRLTDMASAEATSYIRSARDELEALVGRSVRLYRPPYGAQTVRSYRAVRRAGMQVVVWSADAEDWVDRMVNEVVADAMANVGPGGILLLHERLEPDPLRGAPVTTFDRCAVVRGVIEECRRYGLEPGRVGDLVATSGAISTAWFRP